LRCGLCGADATVKESATDTLGDPGDRGEEDDQRNPKRKENKPKNETNHWIDLGHQKTIYRIRVSGRVRMKDSHARSNSRMDAATGFVAGFGPGVRVDSGDVRSHYGFVCSP
jgi:hypothetical protein